MKKTFIYVAIGLIPLAACTTAPTLTDDCAFFTNSTESTIHLKNDPNKAVDYLISCVINVSKDIIIDPGTVIHFSENAGINVPEGGSLRAIGTAENPIVLSGSIKQKGSWKGIRFESSNIKNQFEYVTIEYAGEGDYDSNKDKGAIIVSHHGKLTLKNCTIQHNTEFGVNILSEDGRIENSLFSNNDCPIKVIPSAINALQPNNQFINNIKNQIWVTLDIGYISSDITMINPTIPYYFKYQSGVLMIKGNLKINPGVEIIMSPGAAILVDGGSSSFNAVGTPDEPIVFRGEIEQAGAWKNIYFQFTSSILNRIENAKIMHAGENQSQTDAAIELWADPTLTLNNVEFSQIQGCEVKSHTTNPENLTYTNLTNNGNSVTICE